MNTWILLLRGVNVGGRNILRMAPLRATLGTLGLEDVRTYIQSGNAVFRSRHRSPSALRRRIVSAIGDTAGFEPGAVLLPRAALVDAIDANPFSGIVTDPRRLYLFFLAGRPGNPDLEALQRLGTRDERFELIGELFYLHAPEGLARSKLGAAIENRLGVEATARNWRTVERLAALAKTVCR